MTVFVNNKSTVAWLPALVDLIFVTEQFVLSKDKLLETVSVPVVPISMVVLSPENIKSKMVGLLLGSIFTLLLTIKLSIIPSFSDEIW